MDAGSFMTDTVIYICVSHMHTSFNINFIFLCDLQIWCSYINAYTHTHSENINKDFIQSVADTLR